MMEQYNSIKSQTPDALLFFRLGDFYELFGEDAREASRLLNITLTSRTSGEGRSVSVPMAGVPYHAAPNYIQKLLHAGKKVAVCEQMESPKDAKGSLRRELVRVVTPGTALDEAFLETKANNFLACVHAGRKLCGLAAADNTTGAFFAMECAPEDLEGELARLKPAEILHPEGSPAPSQDALCSAVDAYSFSPQEAARLLKEHFQVASLEGFGLQEEGPATQAAGALLAYLKKTQKSSLSHVTSLSRRDSSQFMRLDASAQRHLELVSNQEDGSVRNTLLEVLDRTMTAAGGRLLKRWILSPLMDLAAIRARQEAVSELGGAECGGSDLGPKLRERLEATTDLERALGKVGCLAAGARDLASIRATLREAPAILLLLESARSPLLKSMAGRDPQREVLGWLEAALVEDPPLFTREGGMFRPGHSAELDQVVADSHGGRDLVLAIQEKERAASSNPKLKVLFNNVFGFYIEVSKAQSSAVPAHWERKQTLVNAERFTTPELREVEARVLGADERRRALEMKLFEALRDKVGARSRELSALAADLATADCLASLAQAARELDYVRPEVVEEPVLEFEAGRHPVIEQLLRGKGSQAFTANDCQLDASSRQLMLITGPNMAGKSTYMRQAALIALMAQTGSFVPAKRTKCGLVDALFTRVGASDRLNRGMSTFLVEMTETAAILRQASRRSLVILDEIGRGTSTYDGVSIAWAVAEHLHEAPGLGCRTLFATHYFELTELAQKLPRIFNACVAVREWNGKILFLHEIKPGSSEHSHGISVARLAGVPEEVVARAREVLARLEAKPPAASGPAPQMDLFQASPPGQAQVIAELEALDLDGTTPRDALIKLASWKDALRRGVRP